MGGENHITYESSGGVARVGLCRPERMNAFTTGMLSEFAGAIARAETDDEIGVIFVHGAGKHFCTGADISEFRDLEAIRREWQASPENVPGIDAVTALWEARKPLVAAVEGNAVGWGGTMLLLMDFVVASEGARFRYPFVDLGIVPDAGASWILPRLVGWQKASSMLLSGDTHTAKEMSEAGLIYRLTEPGRAYETAEELARRLAGKSHAALLETKRLLRRGSPDFLDQMKDEFATFARMVAEPGSQAAIAKLLNSR